MDRIKKTTSTAFMPDGFSWPATEEIYEAKRPGWLPFLSIGQGIAEVGAIENRQYKYSTKADRSTSVDILSSAPILAIPC
jgi:hypothetical protein